MREKSRTKAIAWPHALGTLVGGRMQPMVGPERAAEEAHRPVMPCLALEHVHRGAVRLAAQRSQRGVEVAAVVLVIARDEDGGPRELPRPGDRGAGAAQVARDHHDVGVGVRRGQRMHRQMQVGEEGDLHAWLSVQAQP
jgi:hypothetical protein